MAKIGPKEARRRELRERNFGAPRRSSAKAVHGLGAINAAVIRNIETAPQADAAAVKETTTMKKTSKKKTSPKRAKTAKKKIVPAARKLQAKKAAPKAASARKGVPAQAVADFISRPTGASMAELVAEFGIESHPMRAKIHYVRHKLGWSVEIKDGRYYATEPKQDAA